MTVDGDVVRAPGRTEDSVRQEVAASCSRARWSFPPAIGGRSRARTKRSRSRGQFLQRAFVIAVLLITLVLVTQFDSVILPFTIMVSVVLSLIGVLLGADRDRTPFGIIMTGIGVISLAGIVVNNAIVLCDFIRQLREQGVEKTEAVIEAGVIRLRPVLLTAVTTVLGLIPLTLGINIDFFRHDDRDRRAVVSVLVLHGRRGHLRADRGDRADARRGADHLPQPRLALRRAGFADRSGGGNDGAAVKRGSKREVVARSRARVGGAAEIARGGPRIGSDRHGETP